MGAHECHGVHVEVREQFWGVVSHLPPYCFRTTLVSAMQSTPGYLVPRTPADSHVSAYSCRSVGIIDVCFGAAGSF